MNKFDAIIVLSGGRKSNGELNDSSIARLDKAVDIYKQGDAKLIFALGGYSEDYRKNALLFTKANADLHKDYLETKGIFPGDIVFSNNECKDTIGEALESRKWLRRLGLKKILLVTSQEQLERAVFVFRQILGTEYEISAVEVPPGFILMEEEKEYLQLVRKYFGEIPKGLVEINLEDWHKNHIDLYEALERIHDKFHGTLSSRT